MHSDLDQDQEQLLDPDSYKQAKIKIYNLLLRRDYTQQELTDKLINKGFEYKLVKEVLLEFTNNNLQSDTRTAKMLLSHGYKSGWGPNKIRAQMQAKGIEPNIISSVMSQKESLNCLNNNEENNKKTVEELKEILESYDMSQNDILSSRSSTQCAEPRSLLEDPISKGGMTDYQYMEYFDFSQLAKEQLLKKFAKQLNFSENSKIDWQTKAKMQRFLYNKGFMQDQVEFALSNLCDHYEVS